jgi:hypothetical protein
VSTKPEALPIVAWATHHDEPMLWPTEQEASAYCDDDEEPIPLTDQATATARISELEAEVERLRPLADRYEWLRQCSSVSSCHGAVTINWPIYEKGRLIDGEHTASCEELDRLIDARLVFGRQAQKG